MSALGVLQNPHYTHSRSIDKLAHSPPDGKLHNHNVVKSTYGHKISVAWIETVKSSVVHTMLKTASKLKTAKSLNLCLLFIICGSSSQYEHIQCTNPVLSTFNSCAISKQEVLHNKHGWRITWDEDVAVLLWHQARLHNQENFFECIFLSMNSLHFDTEGFVFVFSHGWNSSSINLRNFTN